jgi:tetratricopeptide (TPR) repeat protein
LKEGSADAVARFERERRLQAALGETEGFVPLLGTGIARDGRQFFLVMPFLPGGTLRQRLEAGLLPVVEAVRIGRALARALGRAHALGIVHRDVKPENVLFTEGSEPLVADLGLAKHFLDWTPGASQSQHLSRTGGFRGTAGYMPLEQMRDSKSVRPEADVFALGAVIYECLAGSPAFAGESFVELLTRVDHGRFPPLRKARPEVPAWLAAAVERALEREPGKRFADASALARALEAGSVQEEGKAAGAPPRRGRALLLLAVGALVLGGGLAFLPREREPVKVTAPPPPAPVRQKEPPPAPASRHAVAKEATARADAAVAAGDLTHARLEYDAAIASAPDYLDAWIARAALREHEGDTDGALADATRATELDPGSRLAWHNLGVMRGYKRDHVGQIAAFSRAVAIDPGSAGDWMALGNAKALNEEPGFGLAEITKAIELAPDEPANWNARSFARARKGELDGAFEDVTRAIEIDPTKARFWIQRASIRETKEDWKGMLVDAAGALAADPRCAAAYDIRSDADLQLHDFEATIADATRAIELEPDLAKAIVTRAAAYQKVGKLALSIADLERYAELVPDAAEDVRPKIAAMRARLARGDK